MPYIEDEVCALKMTVAALEQRLKLLEDAQRPLQAVGPVPGTPWVPSPPPSGPVFGMYACPGCGQYVASPHSCHIWR